MDLLYALLPIAGCALVMFVCMRVMMAMHRRSTGPAVRQDPHSASEEEVAPRERPLPRTSRTPEGDA
jgi:hypothetical protein